jgi:hypothetical protein
MAAGQIAASGHRGARGLVAEHIARLAGILVHGTARELVGTDARRAVAEGGLQWIGHGCILLWGW